MKSLLIMSILPAGTFVAAICAISHQTLVVVLSILVIVFLSVKFNRFRTEYLAKPGK